MKTSIIANKDISPHLYSFFNNSNKFKFNFYNIKEIDQVESKYVILLILEDTTLQELNKIVDIINNYKKNFLFFLPSNLNKEKIINNFSKIHYPIEISIFEKKIYSFQNLLKLSFKNLYLNNENMLINIENNSSVYLTELEVSILKIFFTNKKASKDELKIKALKIKPDIESKTLEAHVYRLRKKIAKICTKTTIMNLDKQYLILKNLT